MRVLQVIPRFNPKHGGGVDVVYNISKFLARRGHKVTIITTTYEFDERFANTIREEGVEVIPFNYIFNYCLFIPSPDMEKWLAKNIKDYDVVHLNGARSYQNNIVCKFAIQSNIPYILQAHGSILRIVSRKKIKLAYDIFWGNNIIKNVSKCIALSESEKEAYKIAGIDGRKVEIIPNGVDISKFNNLPPKGEFKKKYSLSEEEMLVIYLGRLHESKGIDLLPEAFQLLLGKVSNVRFFFVGPDDGYGEEVKKSVKSLSLETKVIFTGLVPEFEKYMALVDGNLFITPKFYGFPISFLEAWACGLPVVTTNEGDCLPWIDNYVGYVVDYSTEKLSNSMYNLLTDKIKRQDLSNNAKSLVRNELNWEKIAQKVEILYSSSL